MRTADYGIDAPGVIRNLFVIGGFALLAGAFAPWPVAGVNARGMVVSVGAVCLLAGALMILYAEWGKFRQRDRMLAMVRWTGAENVLDVGTGRGLLALGAAKRLTTGTAIGIDVWNAKDLTGNSADAFLTNAEAEDLVERVEVRNADARQLPFPDASFDVVVSNLCLHNIAERQGRAGACREIARVLKPGGVALVSDYKWTGDYARTFDAAGLTATRSPVRLLDTFPPLRIVRAEKSAS